MGSRIRPDYEQLFEVFVEVARPTEATEEPFILQKYPEDFNEEDTLKSLPKFIFPCETESTTVDHFTFVLTDIDGKFRFCFCRHATGALTALCIVSCLPWYEIFYKLLNYLAEITNNSDGKSVVPLLKAFYKHPLPKEPLELCEVISSNLKEKFQFYTPNLQSLPTIPESRNLTEYYNAIDTNNMIIIFASMLFERRILMVSRKLSRLTACVHASATLLNPMFWQHLYIPILPPHLIDYCSAPMPYLIGIHSSFLQKLRMSELGDAVILDADKNEIHTEYDDLAALPQDVVSSLRKRLRGQQLDKMSSSMVGDWLARSFLKAMVALIGGYRDALRFRPGESISFDQDAFIQSRPHNMQPFLERMLQLQIFEQFINDRLEMLNTGKGFADEFEMENNLMGDKWGTQSRYKDWSNNMKKFKKEGKEKWFEFTGKVKDKSKKAYSNIRSEIDKLRNSPDKTELPPNAVHRNRPQTVPVAGVVKPQRPLRPPNPAIDAHKTILRTSSALDIGAHRSECHSASISKRQSSDDSEVNMTLNRVSLDLMQDQDIQAIFKKSYSLEDLTAASQEDEESDSNTELSKEDTDQLNRNTVNDTEVVQASGTPNHVGVKRPVPAPRRSVQRQSMMPLIELEFEEPQLLAENKNESGLSSENAESLASLTPNSSSEGSLDNISFKTSEGNVASTDSLPVPKMRGSVARKNAFYNNKRPTSFTRASPVQATDAQTIKEARTTFMQTENIPKTLTSSGTSLDQFDPLLTGQLVIDNKSESNETKQNDSANDVNLLKDWTGIDFNKRRATGPPTPPKPSIHHQKPVGFVNMMASQYNTTSHSSTLPRMGATSLPVQNVGPPMMRPIVPQNITSAQNFNPSYPAASNVHPSYRNTANKSFLYNSMYVGSHTNIRQPHDSYSNANSAIQDPFSDLLSQAQNVKASSTSDLSKTTVSPPMMKPLPGAGVSLARLETGQTETSNKSIMGVSNNNPFQPVINNNKTQFHEQQSNAVGRVVTDKVKQWETFD